MIRFFLHAHRAKLVYFLCASSAIALLSMERRGSVEDIERVIAFFPGVFISLYDHFVIRVSRSLSTYDELEKENIRLKKLLSTQLNEMIQARAINLEGQIREQDAKNIPLIHATLSQYRDDLVHAHVINRYSGQQGWLFQINAGLSSNVMVDMPVFALNPEADDPYHQITLVGKVWKSYAFYSMVLPVTSHMFSIRGRVRPLGAKSPLTTALTVTGMGRDLQYAQGHDIGHSSATSLLKGDEIYTDWGQPDSYYPPGLYIGSVVHSIPTAQGANPDTNRRYKIEVGGSLTKIDTVYVLSHDPGSL